MIIPFEDLVHTVKVYRRQEAAGIDGELVIENVDPVSVLGVVVPRSGTVTRGQREHINTGTLVLCEYHSAIQPNRWIECFEAGGGMILSGTIEQAIDPNNLHDHLELQVTENGGRT